MDEAKKIINSALKSYPRNLLLNQYKIDLNQGNNTSSFNCKNKEHVIAEILYITSNALSSQSIYPLSDFYLNLAKYLNKDFHSYDTLLAENFYKVNNFEEAKKTNSEYFGKYPGIRDFQKYQVENSKRSGYSETLLGRRRYLDDINSPNARIRGFAERVAINMPIQGTAAEIIKVAMIKLGQAIRREKMNSKMLIQVHDELIFEVAPGELMEIGAMINEIMPNAIQLEVPVLVDIKTGSSWGSLD